MIPEHVPGLIEYLLVLPPEGSSDDRSFKFPFLVSRIFNKFTDILDEINEKEEWIKQILGVLDQPPPINLVITMYFTEFCENLLSRDKKLLKVVVRDCPECIFSHLGNRNLNSFVINILSKCAKSEKYYEFAEKIVGWLVDGTKSEECCTNAQEILSACIVEDPIYQKFKGYAEEMFLDFYEKSRKVQLNRLKVIKVFLEKEKDLKFIDEDFWGTEETVDVIQKHSELYEKWLSTENNPWILMSMGIKIQTVGFNIMVALEIIGLFVDMRQERVNEIITSEKLMEKVLGLLENHQLSSVFHNNFTNFAMICLSSALFSKFVSLLLPFLSKYFITTNENPQKSFGFLATCYKTGSMLMNLSKTNNQIQEILENNQTWVEIEKFLIEKMTVNSNLIEYL